jgi:hypothetical protein
VLLEERVDADDPTPSVAQLDALLDERPWLIGLAQVCAGSRAQIRRAWTALAASVPAAPFSELAAPWFQDALSALMELEALAAARAGAARSALLRGDHPGELGGVLFGAARVPLWVEALRQVQGAGPAHASLLFSSDRVPSSLRAFVEASGRDAPVDLDQALLAAASEPAGRLLRALSRSAHPTLTTAAFEGSCSS